MATSISLLHAQIAKLQKKAHDLKQSALSRIHREIQQHGLTAEDIFGSGAPATKERKAGPAKKAKPTGAKAPRASKYGDKDGNVWGGMGKRPQWLRDALDGGAALESFLLSAKTSKAPKQKAVAGAAKPTLTRKAATKGAVKRKAVAKEGSAKTVAKPAVEASASRKPRPKHAASKPAEATAE